MRQQTFAAGDFERYRKATRREQFLAEMGKLVPWNQSCALIEPFYPKGNRISAIQRRIRRKPGQKAALETRFQ